MCSSSNTSNTFCKSWKENVTKNRTNESLNAEQFTFTEIFYTIVKFYNDRWHFVVLSFANSC